MHPRPSGPSAARLAPREFRGRTGIALVYDRQPIADHFRRVDADHVIGLMERTGMVRPFFFLLSREGPALSSLPRPPD